MKLDISSEPAVGDALEIMLLPSLLFINGGKLMYRLHGNSLQIFVAAVQFVARERTREIFCTYMTTAPIVRVLSL